MFSKIKLFCFLFLFGFPLSISFSQNTSEAEFEKLYNLAENFKNQKNLDSALYYGNKAKIFALGDSNNFNIARSFSLLGDLYMLKMNSAKAIACYTDALNLSERHHIELYKIYVKTKIIDILISTGKLFDSYKMLKENFRDVLRLSNDSLLAENYFQLGRYFYDFYPLKSDSSTIALKKAIDILEPIGNKKNIARAYEHYGYAFYRNNNRDRAISTYEYTIGLFSELNDYCSLGSIEKRLGDVYYQYKNNNKAIEYYLRAHDYFVKCGDNYFLSISATDIAYMYGLIGDKEKLMVFSQLAENYSQKNKSAEGQEYMGKWLADIFEKLGDYPNAYKFHKIYKNSLDSLNNNRVLSEMISVQNDVVHKNELFEKELQYAREKAVQQKEKEHQRLLINIAVIGIIILVIFLFFVFNSYRQKKKQNEIITLQKIEVESQKLIVEEKNKEISDSIRYAERIQKALLPSIDEIKKSINNSFVMFRPCNVVSGDFFWFKQIDERIYIAAVDCTGHGVPGALMSMIGNTLLHEIVENNKLVKPGDILNELRKDVIRSLKQTGAEGENQDGMDIALCMIQGNKLEFAGAHNPMWLIRNGVLLEYKADTQPAGITYGIQKPFTNNTIETQPGDSIYIFTDGYADQFGGPKGKKFKYSQLKETLLNIQKEEMAKQAELLDEKFANWKGTMDQIDDVLVIGIRV